MAFTDYLDLRTAVVEEMAAPQVVDVFDRLTKLAEAHFNRKLRLNDQITQATVTFSSGSASLPSDFLEVLGLFDSSGYEYVQQPVHATKYSGPRSFYAVQGANLVTQGADGARTLLYYARLSTLTASMTTSNWLLQKYPSVYLYGVQAEVAKHLRKVDEALALSRLRDDAINEAIADDERYRYSRARVRVQGVTP